MQCIPLRDVDASLLAPSVTTAYCPYKGEATYFTIATDPGEDLTDAIWRYEHPHPAVAAIAGHVAFYPDKAEIAIQQP